MLRVRVDTIYARLNHGEYAGAIRVHSGKSFRWLVPRRAVEGTMEVVGR